VDPALVRHYFDSKVALFVESMRPPIDLSTQAERIATGDPDKVGERVIAFFIATWTHPVHGDRVVAMLRAALDHPEVAGFVRKAIVENVIEEVARRVGSTDPAAAAVSAASQVIGLTLLRHAARLEPLASMPPEELVRRFAPVITYHLTGQFPLQHDSSHGE
jgi:AcrR family transcriptional regulator